MAYHYYGVKMIERFIQHTDIEKIKKQQKFSKKLFEELSIVEKDELLKQIAQKLNLIKER
jgi:hypothetical protein